MTLLAQEEIAGSARELREGLEATMQQLARAQSEADIDPRTAPKHLLTVLTQLLVDQLEHSADSANIPGHGAWLSNSPAGVVPEGFAGNMNALLLTTELTDGSPHYSPGSVFRVTDSKGFSSAFGQELDDFLSNWIKPSQEKWQQWLKVAQPVLIELSPVCDLAQGHRVNSILVAGVIAPAKYEKPAKAQGEAFGKLDKFHLRWPFEDFPAQEVFLGYCNRYRLTLPAGEEADWLKRWFRLRDLPIASIRNANSAHAARVGYVSLR